MDAANRAEHLPGSASTAGSRLVSAHPLRVASTSTAASDAPPTLPGTLSRAFTTTAVPVSRNVGIGGAGAFANP